jgi:flagellar biosynthesis protein FliQ
MEPRGRLAFEEFLLTLVKSKGGIRMPLTEVIELTRRTLQVAFVVSAPILAAAMIVSALISLGQVLTSMQDATLATVPRLAAVATFAFWLTPWMMRKLVQFTVGLFSDFRLFTQ